MICREVLECLDRIKDYKNTGGRADISDLEIDYLSQRDLIIKKTPQEMTELLGVPFPEFQNYYNGLIHEESKLRGKVSSCEKELTFWSRLWAGRQKTKKRREELNNNKKILDDLEEKTRKASVINFEFPCYRPTRGENFYIKITKKTEFGILYNPQKYKHSLKNRQEDYKNPKLSDNILDSDFDRVWAVATRLFEMNPNIWEMDLVGLVAKKTGDSLEEVAETYEQLRIQYVKQHNLTGIHLTAALESMPYLRIDVIEPLVEAHKMKKTYGGFRSYHNSEVSHSEWDQDCWINDVNVPEGGYYASKTVIDSPEKIFIRQPLNK